MAQPVPEIRKVLILSTAHLTEADAKDLDNSKPGENWADCIHAGYFCYVPPHKSSDESEYPPAVKPLLYYARRHGCLHIRFDCDGPIVDELATYDW